MNYDTAIPIGRGGMGEVLEAWDPRLERKVALKYLHRDDPVLVERLLREARAQARLDHPNICKVYEVGDDENGRPFIAMQFVDGRPLNVAAAEMTVDQKIAVMRDVADAVHHAHTAGVIHRDLKPGNILVEGRDDGAWKPYVVDFGLAREREAPGLTHTGEVMGTPAYMAPEQARGDIHHIDRRTDVYALGAVLYATLGGRPPFAGDSSVAVLIRVLQEVPVRLRRLDPSLPADLEVVALTCLEKEPQHRYPSARALADDLERYLEGEPVLARPVSWPVRVARRARRRPLLAAVVAAAAAVALVGVGFGFHARWTAAQGARLAQRFGQEVERIDAQIRHAHLAPVHDVRPDRETVRERMRSIAAEIERLGAAAVGPGSYALGRGHLGLGESQAAATALQRAWAAGYRGPELELALGLALGERYQEEVERARAITETGLREARLRDVEQLYREPALEHLRAARSSGDEPPGLADANIAFFEEQFEDALRVAEAAFSRSPWMYEARLLAGDVLRGQGHRRRKAGDHEGAMEAFHRAEQLYRDAADTGRSDPATHLALCGLSVEVIEALFYDRGGEVQPWFDRAVGSCGLALQADPQASDAHVRLSSAHLFLARQRMRVGEDALPALEEALAAGRLAVEAEPGNARGYRSLGDAHLYRSGQLARQGGDPWLDLEASIASLEKAIAKDPAYVSAHNSLATAYVDRINLEVARGENPEPSIAAAIAACDKALELVPGFTHAHNNLGIIYRLRGEHEARSGKDPRESLQAAASSYRRAIASNPEYSYAYNNLGNIYLAQGEYEVEHGIDPGSTLEEALRWYGQATERNPTWAFPWLNAGLAHRLLGRWARLAGEDAEAQLVEAADSLSTGVEMLGGHPVAYAELARVHLERARAAVDGGRSAEEALRDGERTIGQSLAIDPTSGDAMRVRGELGLIRALAGAQGRDLMRFSLRGPRRDLEAAVAANARDAEAALALAELAGVGMRAGEPVTEAVEEGLARVEEALAINAQLAQAHVVKGALLLELARAVQDAEQRRDIAADAARSFDAAFAINPLLKRRSGEQATEARTLAGETPAE